MSVDKNSCYQISGILNALCILISGIYGFVDVSIDRNNYLTNVIVNLSSIIFSFLFIYYELNSIPDQKSYFNKFILFLFSGLLILGTSDVGFALGFIVILYSLINISLYYIEYNKTNDNINDNSNNQNNLNGNPNNNQNNLNGNPNNNQNNNQNNSGPYSREERYDVSPPNPYRMNSSNSYNGIVPEPNNYDVNTINQNGNIVQYGPQD